MIYFDTNAALELSGAAFTGVWGLFTSPMMPLSAWFGTAYWLLLDTKKNPQSDWVAWVKVTSSGFILGLAIIVDLLRWAQS